MSIKINVFEKNESIINFDILDYGNVIMDYDTGISSCKPFNEQELSILDFELYVLDNIEEILNTLSISTIFIYSELEEISNLLNMELYEIELDDIEIETMLIWLDKCLPVLTKLEDYENCQLIIKLKDYLEDYLEDYLTDY